jgi:AcrR family transcriptional regulator
MRSSPDDGGPTGGLRERKKAKTRVAIQEQALRLFQEQGYAATSVEQIAAAAEVSPSTFFRYFPTKVDGVLYDALDPLIFAAFRAQPPDLRPIQAVRAAFREVFAALSDTEFAQQQERAVLIFQVPELRMRMLDESFRAVQMMAELIAERVGQSADDLAVRAFIGAVAGVVLAVIPLDPTAPLTTYLERVDAGLACLEAGLPL